MTARDPYCERLCAVIDRAYSGKSARWMVLAGLGAALLAMPIHAADNALLTAVKKGDSAAVQRLLQQGTAANTPAADGSTPLHWAVEADDLEMVRVLLKAGADAKGTNRYGMTPLHLAAVNGNATLMGALLDAGADANAVLPEGETVLMTSARTGSAEAIKLLLDRGVKVDSRDKWYGESALMWAVAENHADAVSLLLANGAPLDSRSALLKINRRVGQNILSLGNWTPIMYAARENALDAGRVLIKAKADLNLTDPDGATALVIAIINAHYEFAALLLDAGADPNIVDTDAGMGALYAAVDMHRLAVGHGRPNPKPVGLTSAVDVVKKMLDKGADPNIKLKKAIMQRHHTTGDSALGAGATPFLRAAKSGDVDMMRALVAGGADPKIAMPSSGVNAMLFAAGQGWRNGSPAAPSYDQGTDEEAVEAIRYLLELGFDIQATNDTGDSPLHVAISTRGSEAIIKFLVSQGANIEAKNKRGQTPLAAATAKGNDAVNALLVAVHAAIQIQGQ